MGHPLRTVAGFKRRLLDDRAFGREKFVALVGAAFLGGEARENWNPSVFDGAGRSQGFDPKQRQDNTGQQISGPGATGEVKMAAKNAAQPLFFLGLENRESDGVAVHLTVEVVMGSVVTASIITASIVAFSISAVRAQ